MFSFWRQTSATPTLPLMLKSKKKSEGDAVNAVAALFKRRISASEQITVFLVVSPSTAKQQTDR